MRKLPWRASLKTAGGSYLPAPATFVLRAELHNDPERIIRIELDRQQATELRAALTVFLNRTK
jgi:hypothetical protein